MIQKISPSPLSMVFWGILGLAVLPSSVSSVQAATPAEQKIAQAAETDQYTYLLFYRQDDRATQVMQKVIEEHVAKHSEQTHFLKVKVTDRNEAALVKRFDATRMPLPTVMGLAPNGAVTGVYSQTVKPERLERAMLTPQYADMVLALQQQKIAVVCLQPPQSNKVPAAISEFEKEAALQGKIHLVTAQANDPAETRFFERMGVETDILEPVVLLFAPPGVHLGTFPANVTASTLSSKVHESGSCDCEKCRSGHHHKK